MEEGEGRDIMGTPGRGSKHGAAHTTCVLADALAKS